MTNKTKEKYREFQNTWQYKRLMSIDSMVYRNRDRMLQGPDKEVFVEKMAKLLIKAYDNIDSLIEKHK